MSSVGRGQPEGQADSSQIKSRWARDGNGDPEEGGSRSCKDLHGHGEESGFYFKRHVTSSDL